MSNNPSNLDLITSGQSQKEVTANAMFTAASPAMIYGRRELASAGLVWAFYGGVLKTGSGYLTLSNGSVSLTNASDNYVEADLSTGVVSANTVEFTSGRLALYKVTCVGGQATAWVDYRQALLGAQGAAILAFTDLTDTPNAYTGQEGKAVVVNPGATGLEFVDLPAAGAADFTDLGDAPSSYTGQAGKVVRVKSTEDGLEFSVGGGGGAEAFTDLDDVPSSYTGQEGKMVVVNAGATGLEFAATPAPGAESFTDLDDVPSSFGGQAGKMVVVNGTSTALVFADVPETGAEAFTELSDVPASYSGEGGKTVRVKLDESGLEFTDATGGGHEWIYDVLVQSGLTMTLRGGRLQLASGSFLQVIDQNITVEDTVFQNYVEIDRNNGNVLVNSLGFTPDYLPLFIVQASSGNINTVQDLRMVLNGSFNGTFEGLEDVFGTYAGNEGKFVRVSASGLGLEFATASGGGAEDFTDLNDVPNTYAGAGGQVVKVKSTEDGLEFVPGGAGVEAFTDLSDVPASYTGQEGKMVVVNAGATGLEFANLPGGSEDTSLYAQRSSTTSGLTWGYYGGILWGFYYARVEVPAGTVTLADNATNYVQLQRSNGVLSVNQVGFDVSFRQPVATIVTSGGAIVSYADERQKMVGNQSLQLSVNSAQYDLGFRSPDDVAHFKDGNANKVLVLGEDDFFYYRPIPYRTLDITETQGQLSTGNTTASATFKMGLVKLLDGTVVQSTGSIFELSEGDNYLQVNRSTGEVGNYLGGWEAAQYQLAKITVVDAEISTIEDMRVTDLSGPVVDSIVATFNGGGVALLPGTTVDVVVPYACTIQSYTFLADASGSIEVSVWADSYDNFPPTNADNIAGTNPPAIVSSLKARDTTLTGWTKAVAAGTILRFTVTSAATITRATLSLAVTRT